MSPRVWLRAWRIRRNRRNVPTFTVHELADLIDQVRRPNPGDKS